MEREAINEFVDNLIKDRTIPKSDKDELKEVLEESSKLLDNDSLYDFLKHVKEGFEASGSNIFDENGLNIYSIKNITEKVVSEVKKEKNRKAERKQQEENEDRDAVFKTNEDWNYEKNEDKIESLMESVDEYIEENPQSTYSEAIASILKKDKINSIVKDLLKENLHPEEKFMDELKNRMVQNGFSEGELIDYFADIPIPENEENPVFHGMNLTKLQMLAYGAKVISEEDGNTYYELPIEYINEDQKENSNSDFSEGSKEDYESEKLEFSEGTSKGHESEKPESSKGLDEGSEDKKSERSEGLTGGNGTPKPNKNENLNGSQIVEVSNIKQARSFSSLFGKTNKNLEFYEQQVQIHLQARNERMDNCINNGKISGDLESSVRARLKAERNLWLKARERARKKGNSQLCSNPLMTTNAKREMILKMYFEGGLSAVEISEKLRIAGEIPDDVKLPTADVIEVIVEETARLGFKKEAIELQKREEEIEELWELEKTYTEIQEKRKENFRHEIPDVAVKIKELRYIREIQDEEGSELRLDVLRKQNERRKQVEAAKKEKNGSLAEEYGLKTESGLENTTEQRPQLRQTHIKGIAKGMKIKEIATSDLMAESNILKDLVREYNDNLHEKQNEAEKDMSD